MVGFAPVASTPVSAADLGAAFTAQPGAGVQITTGTGGGGGATYNGTSSGAGGFARVTVF